VNWPADWLRPTWPAPPGVLALSTTRFGGVSHGPWRSLNLAAHVGDDLAAVAANRARLAKHLPAAPVWLQQVHGVTVIDPAQYDANAAPPHADAAVTRVAGVACVVLTADCLPVLLCDRSGRVVGAAHAGWRGLADGVLEATVAAMDCDPAQILVWLGPCIGPTAFACGNDVRDAFCQHDPTAAAAFQAHPQYADKWLGDLTALARLRLGAVGVLSSQIYGAAGDSGECTLSQPERFFSYRRDGVCGRMASLIWREASEA